MKWSKVLKKGLEMGGLAGGGAVAVTGADAEKILVDVIAALVGFAIGAAKNWWKNRNK